MKIKIIYITLAIVAFAAIAYIFYPPANSFINNLLNIQGNDQTFILQVLGIDKNGNVVSLNPSSQSVVNGVSGIVSLRFIATVTNTGNITSKNILSVAAPTQLQTAFNIPTSPILVAPGTAYTWTSNDIDANQFAGVSPGNSIAFSVSNQITYTCPLNYQCTLDDKSVIVNGQSANITKSASATYTIQYESATGSSSFTFGGSTSTATTTITPTTTTSTTTTTIPSCVQVYKLQSGNFGRFTCPVGYVSCALYKYNSDCISGGSLQISCAPNTECYINVGSGGWCWIGYGLSSVGQIC